MKNLLNISGIMFLGLMMFSCNSNININSMLPSSQRCTAMQEVCDGKDNDCDGKIDREWDTGFNVCGHVAFGICEYKENVEQGKFCVENKCRCLINSKKEIFVCGGETLNSTKWVLLRDIQKLCTREAMIDGIYYYCGMERFLCDGCGDKELMFVFRRVDIDGAACSRGRLIHVPKTTF